MAPTKLQITITPENAEFLFSNSEQNVVRTIKPTPTGWAMDSNLDFLENDDSVSEALFYAIDDVVVRCGEVCLELENQ